MQIYSSSSAAQSTGDDTVRELLSRLPAAAPVANKPGGGGVTTETVTKTTYSETTVKRVTNNVVTPSVEVRSLQSPCFADKKVEDKGGSGSENNTCASVCKAAVARPFPEQRVTVAYCVFYSNLRTWCLSSPAARSA